MILALRDDTSRHDACRSLYGRSKARLPTGHASRPTRRGTCPIMVLTARVDAGCSRRAGPSGQLTARRDQTPPEGTGATSYWACVAANSSGHMSHHGAHGTGGRWVLPTSWPVWPAYSSSRPDTSGGYRRDFLLGMRRGQLVGAHVPSWCSRHGWTLGAPDELARLASLQLVATRHLRRVQARLPTGHASRPTRRGTCPIMVLTARVDAGCSRRAGPSGQLTARSDQTPPEGTGWTPPDGICVPRWCRSIT